MIDGCSRLCTHVLMIDGCSRLVTGYASMPFRFNTSMPARFQRRSRNRSSQIAYKKKVCVKKQSAIIVCSKFHCSSLPVYLSPSEFSHFSYSSKFFLSPKGFPPPPLSGKDSHAHKKSLATNMILHKSYPLPSCQLRTSHT